jgi:lipid-A-disaccharide synthase
MRVLFIAGEASGDMHGAGVVRELRKLLPAVETFGVGGDMMAAEGMRIVRHVRDVSFMGFVEVLRNLGTIHALEADLRAALEPVPPDAAVLIDYPGFNLRFAKVLKLRRVPVLYYISPQVWAWHKGRVKTMRGLIDQMNVVFPFEVDIYRREGVPVEFVGHPLVERIGASRDRAEFRSALGVPEGGRLLGLFPGSRLQEIERIFPVMLDAARRVSQRTGVVVAVGVASNLGRETLAGYCGPHPDVQLVERQTYDLMQHADAGIVTSGTATLEMGWFGTPMAIVYRTSPVTYALGRMLVDVPAIGLANIVAGRKVVPEFIQHQMTAEAVASAVVRMLEDAVYREEVVRGLSVIRERLGGPGASARVAANVLRLTGRA